MDKVTIKTLNIILLFFMVFSIFDILYENKNNRVVLIMLLALICLITFVRRRILSNRDSEDKCQSVAVTILINSALIYWIMLISGGFGAEVLVFTLISEVTLAYSYKNSIMFAVVNYISFAIIYYLKLSHPGIKDFINIMTEIFNYIFVYGFAFIAKHQITQREELQKTAKELQIKKEELEKAYVKIQESYDTMEQVTILKERNRIAGEIHDTVGHTLTAVLVEMEACKRLMKRDVDASIEKLDLAEDQVRKGLNDIRKSVKALSDSENYPVDFVNSLIAIIRETEKHCGVRIQFDIENGTVLLNGNIKKVVYKALMEGLTNGIRHGESKNFEFSLKVKDDILMFILNNNGKAFENNELGFGLSNMKFRVEQLNGNFSISSCKGEGCIIKIEIPAI